MATGTYTVRAAGAITRRGEGRVRRRGGLVFGQTDVLVSTESGVEGALVVTEKALDAILHDSNLRDKESTDPSTPGLRVKAVDAPKPAAEDEGEPEGEPEQESEEVVEEEQPAPQPTAPKKRGRPKGSTSKK